MEVPGYTEIRELGHGGSGHVMLAVHGPDQRRVAIKHLSERLRADAAFRSRFRAEATLIAELDSPHIARLLEYAEGADDAVIVMELVDGVTLRRLLRDQGATGPEAALAVLKGALLGLAEAHRAGVVHRDFKPENVIVTAEGGSKLVDFGVAARAGEPGVPAGTPAYMAPEQWNDAPASPATDVYAATVVFFECLTGHRPFLGGNDAALAYQHQHAEPPLGNVAEPVRGLVALGLAKDPADRPASAGAFLEELERTAREAYGAGWEEVGRVALGAGAVAGLGVLGLVRPSSGQPYAQGATSLGQTTVGKLALTTGLAVVTAAAVVGTFTIWRDPPPQSVGAAPPSHSSTTPAGTPSPSVSPTALPTASPSDVVPTGLVPTDGPALTTTPPDPTPTSENPDPTSSPHPTRTPTSPAATPPPTTPPATARPTATAAEPTTRPEPTTAPPPTAAPTAQPTQKQPTPLLSVEVRVSVGLPGDGDLLDADIGLDITTGLLGLAVLPLPVLLRRRKTPRPGSGQVARARGAVGPEWGGKGDRKGGEG
ncbi:protein kinase [Nonomuraea sp. NPDC050556]|uniref:protein kinase domain-containing protein n=1 Tax=Nonomuraea sp. NPDC050556 TaxID=3364369 RepID=UPI00379AB1B3